MNGGREEEKAITVFIAARVAFVRAGLEAVLESGGDIIIAGGAADYRAAPLDFSNGKAIDVVLTSVERERELDDLIAFADENQLDGETNFPAIVALLAPELQTRAQLVRALQSNFRAVLPFDAAAEELVAAVKAAAQNLVVLAPELAEILLQAAANPLPRNESANQIDAETVERLTPREQEVLQLLADGASNKSIAQNLGISEHTVKFHVASIFGKLDAATRTEAVTEGLRRGLVLL